ncbi:MAG TPA: DUF1003 domain-containing protein [Aggregatilineales bacterium]|nr:DUF1003 domain-containing protein [Aggregatilineales bacterium]
MYNDLLLDRLAAIREAENEEHVNELIDEIEALESLLSPEAQQLIQNLRPHTVTDDVYEDMDEQASFGERVADRMATFAGSWRFIITFFCIMLLWVAMNLLTGNHGFDPYPFILLNLVLSTLAGLQAPVILMAQNRQSDKDRAVAQNDYQVNLKNELELADLHRKVDVMSDALNIQTRLLNALVSARRQELTATVRAIENARKE